jgi:hypothetical protein
VLSFTSFYVSHQKFLPRFCFSTTVFDNLLVLSYFARGVLMFTECFLGLEPPKKGGHERVLPEELEELNLDPTVLSGQAIQIPIPPEFLSEDGSSERPLQLTMSQIFDLLLVNYEAIVIAVYRDGLDELPYVAIPAAEDEINQNDKLYVVAPPHQIEKLLRNLER